MHIKIQYRRQLVEYKSDQDDDVNEGDAKERQPFDDNGKVSPG